MNILFDARIFEYAIKSNQSRTGIYWVARNIILELIKRNNINVAFYLPENSKNIAKIFEDLQIKSLKILTNEDDLSEINSYFSAFDIIPDEISKYPRISCYTILYDVIYLLYPEYFNPSMYSNYMEPLIKSLKPDMYYFSISDNTKNDFLKYFSQINPLNIQTIPLSTNQEYKPNKDIELFKKAQKKYNIPLNKKYLFSLCSLEPRKNLIRAVKTFIDFIEKNNIDDLVYVLGGAAWEGFIEKLEKEVPNYEKYTDKIIRAGYVDDEDLEILYSNAEWFVYTSQYEGFGMPPLEAMACGCPVITSNNSSLPEVVGDSGIMIDWDSDEQHIQAYEKYYYDEQFRSEMAQKGLERSKLFSWDKAVDIILNKMQEVETKKANKPLVTIITASYNLINGGRKEWFIQNLESVQSQTYKNIEHIVIDGASTDGTIELLEEYQNKGWIKYYSEPDKGIYDALNKGILKANGKYVVCLNSDDFYCDEHAVEWLVSKTEENNADACYGSTNRVDPITLSVISHWDGKENFIPLSNSFPCHQSFLIRTDSMKELGLYASNYKVSADNIFLQKMVNHNKKFVGIENTIISFRDGGYSNSHLEISAKERLNGFYQEYGKYHNLTPYDAKSLLNHYFLHISVDEAINLGCKLDSKEWRDQYFSILINHHIKNSKQIIIQKEDITTLKAIFFLISKVFSIKNEYSLGKKRKVITIMGIKFKIKKK